MTQFFTNLRLLDPEAGTLEPAAVLVRDGVIAEVLDGGATAPDGAEVMDCGGHILAPGIVDIGVKVCEPGERHKESYHSAGLAAAAGCEVASIPVAAVAALPTQSNLCGGRAAQRGQ